MRQHIMLDNVDDPVVLIEYVYQLWRAWANFELIIVSPFIEPISPPLLIDPEVITDNELEFVYPIQDCGNRLLHRKGRTCTRQACLCAAVFTIEKMILFIDRTPKNGWYDEQTEVQIAFGGHELAQRKAFESVINLVQRRCYQFRPRCMGERHLQNVKRLVEKVSAAFQRHLVPLTVNHRAAHLPLNVFQQTSGGCWNFHELLVTWCVVCCYLIK